MKKLFFLLILSTCATPNTNIMDNNINLNFDNNLSFNDFKEMLIQYVENSSYPNIDD